MSECLDRRAEALAICFTIAIIAFDKGLGAVAR